MENNAKHFVLQLGSLASLYLTLSFLITLLFGIITLLYPDADVNSFGNYEVESANSTIRLGIAMVVVFLPTYLLLTRTVNVTRRVSGINYTGITKWLIYLSLLIGGGVLLGDLVAVIMTFLEGDIPFRFILKALTIFILVGGAFYYYLLDAKGYWLTHESEAKLFAAVAIVIAVAAVIFGFTRIDTPSTLRDSRIDQSQISDLRQIQSAVEEHYLLHKALPATLADIKTVNLPTAPEGRAAYTYAVTEQGFKLCATFATKSGQDSTAPYYADKTLITNPESWQHDKGNYCFERVINPAAIPTQAPTTTPTIKESFNRTMPPQPGDGPIKDPEIYKTLPPEPAE